MLPGHAAKDKEQEAEDEQVAGNGEQPDKKEPAQVAENGDRQRGKGGCSGSGGSGARCCAATRKTTTGRKQQGRGPGARSFPGLDPFSPRGFWPEQEGFSLQRGAGAAAAAAGGVAPQ